MRVNRKLALVGMGVLLFLGLARLQPPAPPRNVPPGAGPIVAFGDSLTAGTGAPEGQSYPNQLARLINRPVINRGVPGDTIGSAATRLERDVIALEPAVVIVLLGGNDILRQLDLKESFAELERIVLRIQQEGAMVVLVGIRALPMGGVGDRYRRLARRTGCVYVGNILKGIFGEGALMADPIHPNAAGYGIMAERIAAALDPCL